MIYRFTMFLCPAIYIWQRDANIIIWKWENGKATRVSEIERIMSVLTMQSRSRLMAFIFIYMQHENEFMSISIVTISICLPQSMCSLKILGPYQCYRCSWSAMSQTEQHARGSICMKSFSVLRSLTQQKMYFIVDCWHSAMCLCVFVCGFDQFVLFAFNFAIELELCFSIWRNVMDRMHLSSVARAWAQIGHVHVHGTSHIMACHFVLRMATVVHISTDVNAFWQDTHT